MPTYKGKNSFEISSYIPQIAERWRFCFRLVCRLPYECPSRTLIPASGIIWPEIQFRTDSTTKTRNIWSVVLRWTWADWYSIWAFLVCASILRRVSYPPCSTIFWSRYEITIKYVFISVFIWAESTWMGNIDISKTKNVFPSYLNHFVFGRTTNSN